MLILRSRKEQMEKEKEREAPRERDGGNRDTQMEIFRKRGRPR